VLTASGALPKDAMAHNFVLLNAGVDANAFTMMAISARATAYVPKNAGDKVLYPREAGYEVRLGGIEVRLIKRDDLIARVHD